VADLREIFKPGHRIDVKNPETGAVVRWTVQGLLQEGGRGLVFEVADAEGRPAVLKGPSKAPGAAYSAIIEREILKKVSPHPNVVKYLGSSDESGMPLVLVGWAHENPFLRLNGSPVRERVAVFRDAEVSGVGLPATVAVELCFEVVLALEHLHGCGFVHSDVKPANVMVEIDPTVRELDDAEFFRAISEGRARGILIDVGGARSESFLEDLNSGNVDASIVPPELTPLWAPPEAIVGAETREGRRPIYSAAIDVYQAGLLLGVFLTGQAPYEHLGARYDRNDLAQVMELKAAERRGEVAPFPQGAVRRSRHEDVNWDADAGRSTRGAFDEAVEALLAKTLARDPNQRGTIAQLRVQMERAFDLFPNARARGGQVVAPTFRARSRTLRLESRLSTAGAAGRSATTSLSALGAAAATGTPAPAPATPSLSTSPSEAAAQVLRLAAELGQGPRPSTGAVVRPSARLTPQPPAGPGRPPVPPSGPVPITSQLRPPGGSGATARPGAGTTEALNDRVTIRVAPNQATKAFEVLSREGARSIEVEGGRFEFRCPPMRACEILRLVLDAKVDVFFFERRKGATTAPPTR
jgi:serine/threonine protein kinase